MSDYTELIHDLRYCADRDRPDCSICGYESADKCKDMIKLDAAAAIEDMEKHITEMHERVTVLQIARGELERENEKLKDDLEEQKQIAKHYEQSAKDWWKEAKEYYTIASAKDITAEESEELIRQFKKIPCGLIEPLEPKRGEWELIDGAEPMRWGCSRCKYLSWKTSNYCPRCGAKMEVQDGENES